MDRSATGLIFLPAGPESTKLLHPNEILASAAIKSFFDKLRGTFDYVIVDFPPLAPVVDTRTTTSFIDSYVYVVEWGKTKIDVVEHSLSNAREVYDRLLGVVLNKANMSVLQRYERYRTTYYYRKYDQYRNVSYDARATTGRSGQRLFAALSRVVLISIGVFSVWWGMSTFPVFWRDARLDHTADSIINGEQFKREILQTLLADADSRTRAWARPEALRSAAIIRFGLVEQASVS